MYEKVYTLSSLCLFGKGIKVLVSCPDLTPHETIKALAHNHLIQTTSTTGCTNMASTLCMVVTYSFYGQLFESPFSVHLAEVWLPLKN